MDCLMVRQLRSDKTLDRSCRGLDGVRRAGSDSVTVGSKECLFLMEPPETPRSLELCLVTVG